LQWITIYILDLHLLGERYNQDKAEKSISRLTRSSRFTPV